MATNENHSLLFGYFGIDRESTLLKFAQSYDDIAIIDARVKLSKNPRFYSID